MSYDSMPHQRIVALLAALAGPRGPFATEDDVERLRQEILQGPPAIAAARLLTIVASRTSLPPTVPVTWQEVDYEAAELLSALGEHAEVRALLMRALNDPAVRSVALDALALLADPATAPALAALAAAELNAPFLRDNELVQLASALGCVGGADALAAIQDLRGRAWPPAVARELDIALQTVRNQKTEP